MSQVELERGTQVTVQVTDLAFQGRGVARIDGLVVFVDGGLPGDTVNIEITHRHRRYIESRVLNVVEPSPDRVAPRCAHFGECGGCRLQNLAYEKQLAFKAAQVRNHLQRIGGLEHLPEIPMIACEPTFGYRNKMEFAFGRDSAGRLTLGLHPRETYASVFDLRECHLPSPTFARIVDLTRRHFSSINAPAYDPVAHTGLLRFLVIREGVNSNQFLVNLVTAPGEVADAQDWVSVLKDAVPGLTTAVRTVNAARANIAIGEVTDIWYGPGAFSERLGGLEFELGPLSFFQTNTRQAEKLFATALGYADLSPTDHVLDLYSGAGAISLLAARQAGRVTGVEVVPEAVTAAHAAAGRNGITNCEFVCADVRQFLKNAVVEKDRFDIAIVDPPRAGLHPKVVKRLGELAPPKIVYVSCNPSTLARDVGLFTRGRYRLAQITAVDMFPHTAHIETVALLQLTEEK